MHVSKREMATVRAALEYWKEELAEGQEWIPDSKFFSECSALSVEEVDCLAARLASSGAKGPPPNRSPTRMAPSTQSNAHGFEKAGKRVKQMRLMVPTYNANFYTKQVSEGTKPEFGTPYVPVLVHSADGVRVVLGSHRFLDVDAPDITIERQPRAWAVFLHPIGGGDPAGCIYFLDDGRSYLLKERWIDPSEGIQILEHDARLPDVYPDDAS